jgi:hypothetical protein
MEPERQQRVNTRDSDRLVFDSSRAKSFLFRPMSFPAGIIWARQTVFFLSVAWLFFAAIGACSIAADVPPKHSFVSVAKGPRSGVRERKLAVVKSETEWADLWNLHAALATPRKEPPAVNFQSEMIVAVFAGEKRTGGYAIEITRVEQDPTKNLVEVFVRETKPPPGAITTQALTQPFHIVKLNKTELPVNFVFQ